MTANIKFAKVRPDAKIPSKRDEDMGFDIYACFDEDYMVIKPHETKLIPTGIASACNPEYGFVVFERGSTGSKGIARRCGVIDSGYRNEWFIGLTNTTTKMLIITKLSIEDTISKFIDDWATKINHPANKATEEALREEAKYFVQADRDIFYPYSKAIAQLIVHEVPKMNVSEITYEELKSIPSKRGMGALGSSGK
jgi:dUTP pyrophosphatase